MKTLNESIQKVISKFNKVPPNAIEKIIKEYQKAQMKTLLEYGHLMITPEIRVDIVPITPRRYVLRGQEYKSARLYKLKSSIVSDEFYDKIAKEYDRFREDLL